MKFYVFHTRYFFQINVFPLLYSRISISGSIIGGMGETQELIDFCDAKKIKPAIQIITWDKLAEVYEKLNKGNDSIVRYVLDVEKSK